MNIFKYSRGHFWGTILPGAFFLINIIVVVPDIAHKSGLEDLSDLVKPQGVLVFGVLFIVSYVLGVTLRLLSPRFLELIAFILKAPVQLTTKLLPKFNLCGKYNPEESNINDKAIKDELCILYLPFPYSKWFFDKYLPKTSAEYESFYKDLLKTELKGDYRKFNKFFFNHCKTFIYDNSDGLSEEVMYNEGLTRFICGITYSLLITLLIMIPEFAEFKMLFWIYLGLIMIFLFRLRGVRGKEVLSVFDGYMFIKTR